MSKAATPELIAAIRECATRGMTQVDTAIELTSEAHSLTSGAIAGIASRCGIEFDRKARRPDTKPRVRRTGVAVSRVPITQYGRIVLRKAPPPQCSWFGCMCGAVAGDLFCTEHKRKALT